MRTVESYRGFEIVELDVDGAPVHVIQGMKERVSDPVLGTVEEARSFIDGELAGREALREARTVMWRATVRYRGNSLAVTIPVKLVRSAGLRDGDEVEVSLRKLRSEQGCGRATDAADYSDDSEREGGSQERVNDGWSSYKKR